MILPDEYTTSVVLGLSIFVVYLITIFLLFEIKIRLEGDLSKAFTFLILAMITRGVIRMIDILDVMDLIKDLGILNDILVILFAAFILLFAIRLYRALSWLTDKNKGPKEKEEPEEEPEEKKQTEQPKRAKTPEKIIERPKRKIIGTEEYIDMT